MSRVQRRRARRLVDEAVLGILPAGEHGDLAVALRGDDAARTRYDRVLDAFRVLEHRDVAEVEYGLVERWLEADGVFFATPAAAPGGLLARWLSYVAVAVASAAALVLVFGPLQPEAERMGIKGGSGRGDLGIQALCPGALGSAGSHAVIEGLQSAQEVGCALSGTLSFAYRVQPGAYAGQGTLSLFGIDADGDVMYYAPTPSDPSPLRASTGVWRPLAVAVELDINHVAGDLRLYGIVTPQPLRTAEIDAAAVVLKRMMPAAAKDPPWHERIPSSSRIAALCSTAPGCVSAELEFSIHDGDATGQRFGGNR